MEKRIVSVLSINLFVLVFSGITICQNDYSKEFMRYWKDCTDCYVGEGSDTSYALAYNKAKTGAINDFIMKHFGISIESQNILSVYEKLGDSSVEVVNLGNYSSKQHYYPIENLTFSIIKDTTLLKPNNLIFVYVLIRVEQEEIDRIKSEKDSTIIQGRRFFAEGNIYKSEGDCDAAKIKYASGLKLLKKIKDFDNEAKLLYAELEDNSNGCKEVWELLFPLNDSAIIVKSIHESYRSPNFVSFKILLSYDGYLNIFLVNNSVDDNITNWYPDFSFQLKQQTTQIFLKDTVYEFPLGIPKDYIIDKKSRQSLYGYPIIIDDARDVEECALLILFSTTKIPDVVTKAKTISGLKKNWEVFTAGNNAVNYSFYKKIVLERF